jgi:hypothetical protein
MSASLPIEAGQYSREGQQQQQVAPVVSLEGLARAFRRMPSSEDYASSPTDLSYEVEEGPPAPPAVSLVAAFEIWKNAREYAVLHQLGDFSAIGVDASISSVVGHHFHDE